MKNDLYSIRLIQDAFTGDTPRVALREALREICRRGDMPEYKRGFEQFCKFLECARDTTAIDVVIEQNGTPFGYITTSPYEGVGELQGVMPGLYSAKLSTGRVIWERRLSGQELLWAEAFAERPIEMAADTEQRVRPASIEEFLLDGVLTLFVYPGIEEGTIGIEFTPTAGHAD